MRDLSFNKRENVFSEQGQIPLHFSALAKDVYNEAMVKNRKKDKIAWNLDLPRDCLDLCLEKQSPDLYPLFAQPDRQCGGIH